MSEQHIHNATDLLQKLISTPSLSGEEDKTAALIQSFLDSQNVKTHRIYNNVFAFNEQYDMSKPTLLLNSHHDTVKPNVSWIRNPFSPEIADGKLFGLGSNDAGASLVSLIATFLHFYKHKDLNHNIVIAAKVRRKVPVRREFVLFYLNLDLLIWLLLENRRVWKWLLPKRVLLC